MNKTFICAVFVACSFIAAGVEPSQLAPLPNYDRRAGQPVIAERERATAVLRSQMSEAQVARDPVTQAPKWIASNARFLTGPGGEGGTVQAATAAAFAKGDPHRAVKAFLNEHRSIFGHDATALDAAKISREDVSPSGLRTVVWQQYVEEIPVFEGILKAGLTLRGELVNIGSQFVAAPEAAAKAGTPPGARRITAQQAIVLAAHEAGAEVREDAVAAQGNAAGAQLRQEFTAPGLNGATARLTWLPMDAATLRLCWSVILTNRARGEMFRVLIDAQTGAAHVRHCLTEYISDASYRVFTSDSPTPMSPGLAAPGSSQPPLVARALITTPALDTTASPNGWIDDGVNETFGNNVDAHTDVNNDNQPDLPRPQGSPFRVFDFPLDLTQDPATYRDAAVTNLFYWCNRIHDRYYELGFTESAGNFQNDNFGRGGVGNDAVQADAQDGSGTNNANFSSPPDGMPGRMQMFIFNGPTPGRDGDLDAEVMIHEYTHGLSNRLIGGGTGLFNPQSRGMGEGWSDFYALCLLSEAADNINGNYAAGAYVSYQLAPGYDQNYFFGIRRYPYSTDLTKNPLTFKDIDPTQASPHTGIPLSPLDSSSNANPSEVHGQGEVWCNTLWEARANLVKKFGFPAGNNLILQLVTDGMKLTPVQPTFLQARDAILQADLVSTQGANYNELWAAFAKRGMGASAIAPDSKTTVGVVESYDPADVLDVAPRGSVVASRAFGGAFTPDTFIYTLTNFSAAALDWTAAVAQPWLTPSATSGTLAPGASIQVTVMFNTNAAALDLGNYSNTLTFHNTTSGADLPRTVSLAVDPPRVAYFPLDSDPGWTRTGEWAFGHPTGGGGTPFHNPDPTNGATGVNVFGVNLAGRFSGAISGPFYVTTAAIDLRERESTRLRFQRWLNINRHQYTPATIELSTDGTTWTTVWSNGNDTVEDAAWTPVQYDISAFADNQPTVFIRWGYQVAATVANQIFTGWNVDDIEILGTSDNLDVVIPAFATEGAAPTTGTVTASPAPTSNLVVQLTASDPTRLLVPVSVTIAAGTTSATFPVTVIDDTKLNGSEKVFVTPYAPEWAGHPGTTLVQDNETTTLAVILPATVPENAGSIVGTVIAGAPVASDVIVPLTATNTAGNVVVPDTVTITAGQNSASFPMAVIDNGAIDGNRSVVVSASIANWTSVGALVTILDDENTNLTLTAPTAVSEGFAVNFLCTVSISGTLPSALVVALASDDLTEITVPATVTIPAGQTSVQFYGSVVDDFEEDGAQTVHVSASAPGFTAASATIVVADDEITHFSFGTVPGAQIRGVPFQVSFAAKNIDDSTAIGWSHQVHLSATSDAGPLPIDPTLTANTFFTKFNNGVWTGMMTVNSFGTNVVLTVTDDQGHTGSSNPFSVGTGPLDHFTWDAIAPQIGGAPFSATVRAIDTGGNQISSLFGPANLSAALIATRPPTGMGTAIAKCPQEYYDPVYRRQTIYLASEIGGAGRFTALALNVGVKPTATTEFDHWTIRLKHTTKSIFPGHLAWETDGWTVVHVSNAKIGDSGWVTFPFQTRFDYDGTSNLIVDFSWYNSARPVRQISFNATNFPSTIRNFPPSRTLFVAETTVGMDPLTLPNDDSNGRGTDFNVPNILFTTASPLAMQPAATASFVNGSWTGNLSMATPGATVSVRAQDAGGYFGDSGTFTVSSADGDGDGLPDTWAAQYGVHGAFEDPDSDGLVNLIEYALALDPKAANTLPAPQLVTDPGDDLTYLTWQYRRRLNPGMLIYIVEASDDLATWHSDAAWVQQVGTPTENGDGLTETATVRALPAVTSAANRYLRLRVTLQ